MARRGSKDVVLLLTVSLSVGLSLLKPGFSELLVQSLEGERLNPTNILVGYASDLPVQVQCNKFDTDQTGSESFMWAYQNGTVVQNGLVAFGVSQGEGVLRIYPAGELMSSNEFTCLSSDGSRLNITFNLTDSLFFTSIMSERTNTSESMSSLCSIPDIPMAMLFEIEENVSSYCVVESKRGVYRSPDITDDYPMPLNVTIHTDPELTTDSELIVAEGQPVNVTCDPTENSELIMNNNSLSSNNFTVSRNQSGFYQCLRSGDPDGLIVAVDSVYLLVAYADTPTITPPTLSAVIGKDITISFNCSAPGNPIPRLSLSVYPEVTFEATQLATDFGEPAVSNFIFNLSLLTVRDYEITCTSEVSEVSPSLSNSTSATLTVRVVFENVSIMISMGDQVIVLRDDSINNTVTLNCTVESGLVPTIIWRRNNDIINGTPPTLLEGTTYISSVTVNELDLRPPEEFFQCNASLNISELMANASITVKVVLENITISPMELTVNSLLDQNGNRSENENETVLTCEVTASLLPNITWTENGIEVDGTPAVRVGQSLDLVRSQLTVNPLDKMGVVNYTCVASLEGFISNITAMATITFNVSPFFTVNPLNQTIVVEQDPVTLSCTAKSTPPPSITWEDELGNIFDDEIFNISSERDSTFNVTSFISFIASENRTANGSMFRCVAMNIVDNRTESELGRLLIAGPPGQPEGLNVTNVTFNSAVFVWSSPFSLVNLTGYLLSVNQLQSNSSMVFMPTKFNITADSLSFSSPQIFLPFSLYNASLLAVNGAGRGDEATITFTTLESIPGPPINIRSSTPALGQIKVTWEPTPLGMQNGTLTQYTIQYRNETEQNCCNTTVNSSMLMVTLDGLAPAVNYTIAVAAHTGAGMGPFSDPPITQITFSMPPPIDNIDVNEFASGSVTSNTIQVMLPIINTGEFSHFWVIAMKVESNDINNFDRFTNNESFVFHSTPIQVGMPYVVAEISAQNYNDARSFILGTSNSFNENSKYINGPLDASSFYTVFVWGFVPPPPSGSSSRARRQAQIMRQYTVFSSSGFLPPVSTTAVVVEDSGLSGGAIAGIIIAVIAVILALLGVIIASIILYGRCNYRSDIGPPPSRKGSMRLRDQNEIVRKSLRSSFRITLRNQRAEAELQDLNPDDARLPVPVKEFAEYVRTMRKNTDHLFSEEYEIVTIKSPSLAHIQCSLPTNSDKNRYANINCYDNSRVILEDNKDINSMDYINANYIDGYRTKCAYIATQGPLASTTHDFWRMAWQQETCCIIMLTNLVEKSRVKCHQYWPEVGSMNMGNLTITLIEVQQLAYYTIRTFRVTKGSEVREIKQFHYTGWPDFGVPEYPSPVISFIKRINHFKRTTTGPDIIHCSAGVGRTGTLIAIQTMMEMVKEEGKIDIFNFVLGMRQQRNYMVQTERQYIFIHDTILEHLKLGNTEVSIQNLRRHFKKLQEQNPKIESSLLEQEYRRLNELEEVDKSQFHPASSSVNEPKNRYRNILPYDRYRVRLLLHPGVNGSDYINASYVDGYHSRHQYILTQGPMSNTVTDFWRMVWEHRCSCIMMLCKLEEKENEESVWYWPTDKVRQHGDMFIEQTSVSQYPSYTMREFAITNTKINDSRVIKHYQYTDWSDCQVPPNAAAVIDLIGVLQKTQNMNGRGPIIVHDSTSIGRSGTFVVLSSILEQLKVEGIIDLFFTIHTLRRQQPGLVSNLEQYRFCYQAVVEFLDSFDHYANFELSD